MQLEAGRRIGPYQILSVIGSGGMGTVYLAVDTRLHRRVALKFVQPELSAPIGGFVTRLLHEARAASALNHAGVCQIYDVGGEGADSWIAMEYVEGRPLSELVRPSGLPLHEVVRLGGQIADALAHAHSRGVIHRDLKTANIVCDAAGQTKILDFGIARRRPDEVAAELTTTDAPLDSAFAGTLAYMAPEVIRGEGQDERSDLWSLGIVLSEMASGRRPFEAATAVDLASAIVRDPPRTPAGDLPAGFAALVTRLLAKSRAERYQTAGEVSAALALLAADRPVVPPARRRAAMIVSLCVLAAAAAGWLVYRAGASRSLSITHQQLMSAPEAGHRTPALSPDGTRIAYTAPGAGGIAQLWVRTVASGASIQLTHGQHDVQRPRWFPDDRVLYAASGRGLWVVSALGGTPTRLVDRGRNPDVSRDGTRIVFEAGAGQLWTADGDGSNVRQIVGTAPLYYGLPMGPAFSPDGSQVAYFHAALGPNGDFWVIPTAGGTPRRLTSDLREGGWPVWTRDGRSLIFSSARAGSRTLWQLPLSGGVPLPLTTGAGEDDQPDISSDGQLLTYTNVRNRWELKARDIASGEERTLLRRGLEVIFPTFSPDGGRIAYFGRADEAVAIFTIGASGEDPQQLTAGRELNHSPRWGPDGKDIYFFQEHPSQDFRRVPAVGGPSTTFLPWRWEIQNTPLFDPDGRFIVYVRQRPPGAAATHPENTVVREIATGSERVWPEPHTHPTDWLPGRDEIMGWQHSPALNQRLMTVCRVPDGTCRPVAPGRLPRWSEVDNRIYYLKGPIAPVERLWSMAPDGTDDHFVTELGAFRPIDLHFDVSRTGRIVWAPLHPGRPEVWTASLASR